MKTQTQQTNIWLFGEASVNTSNTPKQEFKKLSAIAEDCGYFVDVVKAVKDRSSAHILVLGEDVPDTHEMHNILNFDEVTNKFTKIQKVLYEIIEGKDFLFSECPKNRKMIKVLDYLGGEFVEVFNRQKHEITLKLDVRYQKALAKENKKDHPLYTGNGVEKRSCTCIEKENCPYYACANCKSTDIIYGNYSHACQKCNRLQDVSVLDAFIVCEKHGKFDRDDQECPKCTREFNLL